MQEKLESHEKLKLEMDELKMQLSKEKYSRVQAENHASRFDALSREILERKQTVGSYESLIENKVFEISR